MFKGSLFEAPKRVPLQEPHICFATPTYLGNSPPLLCNPGQGSMRSNHCRACDLDSASRTLGPWAQPPWQGGACEAQAI